MKKRLLWPSLLMVVIAVLSGPSPTRAQSTVKGPTTPVSIDQLAAAAVIVPELDAPLFHSIATSRLWWIIEDESGEVEDTMDGLLTDDELLLVEHTAALTSTHQGEHMMNFCDAVATPDGGVELHFTGGMPAFASALTLTVDAKLNYTLPSRLFTPAVSAHRNGPSRRRN